MPGDSLRRHLMSAAILALLVAVPPAAAAPITVDGNLADWGVSVRDNNGSDYSGLLGAAIGLLRAHIEDQNDLAGDTGFVGPNYGGQNYDAEFLGVARQGSTVYVAIVTGQRPDNGFRRFAPGDLSITTGSAVFGLEIGGGPGGGAGSPLTEGAAGSFYGLDGSGFTESQSALTTRRVGSIWKDPTWYMDPIVPGSPTQMVRADTGSEVGMADLVYTRDGATAQHAIIELAFDATALGGVTVLREIDWKPTCGNDELHVDLPVAEPGTLLLAAAGLGALGLASRRSRRDPAGPRGLGVRGPRPGRGQDSR